MTDTTEGARFTFTLPQLEAGLRGAIRYADYDLFKALDAAPNEVEEDGDTFATLTGRFVEAATTWVPAGAEPERLAVRVCWADDEEVVIRVGPVDVCDANHDDHGWDGMRVAVETATGLARVLGLPVVTEGVPNL